MEIINSIWEGIQSGDARGMAQLIPQALNENFLPATILQEGLAKGIIEAEKRFQKNEILDSEYLMCEEALRTGMRLLWPWLKVNKAGCIGTVITGTLEGDIREANKDLSSCLMQSLGLRVIDLGSSISGFRFIEAAIEEKAQVIVCITSLTIFLPLMKSLMQAANQMKIRPRTKILLSGGPVTEWFCESINADMYAPDLVRAANMAAEYCKKVHALR